MLKNTLTLICLSLFTLNGISQVKKKLDHQVYDSWNSISNIQQSKTGTVVTYEINPLTGDGNLFIENLITNTKRSFNRGSNASISWSEQTVLFLISPQFDTIRALKLEKAKEETFPKDSLFIYNPTNDSVIKIPNVSSFKMAENGSWYAYHSENDERPICPKKKKCFLHKKKNDCKREESTGTTLHLLNPDTDKNFTIDCVKEYYISKKGDNLIYVTSHKGKKDTLSLHVMNLQTLETKTILEKQFSIKRIKFDFANEQIAILHTTDTNKRKCYELSYWNPEMEKSTLIIDSTTQGLPNKWTVSEFTNPYFSRNGEKIFLGTNKIIEQDPKDTLLDSEKANVDVWSGFDLRIQPQQLIEKRGDERKSYMGVYHIKDKKFIQLEDDNLSSLSQIDHGNTDYILAYADKPYQKSMTWDYPWKNDIYLINLKNGERNLLKSNQAYAYSISPSLTHTIWYNGNDSSWYSKSLETMVETNLTKSSNALFASDNNGNPFVPYSEGASGWTIIGGLEYYIVNSKYDVWALCPSEPELNFSVSEKRGEKDKHQFRLYRFDNDSTYLNLESNFLIGINDKTKAESIYSMRLIAENTVDIMIEQDRINLNALIETNHKFIAIHKSDLNENYLFRRMSFVDYPEIEYTHKNFATIKTLTSTNPQQEEYNWGTVELVDWTSFEGRELRGLLYKPEDFDSTKSYPMITYFYEKYTENLHAYYSPKPTASIVLPTEYVSNGYIIFIPDIEYTPGHPALSAYDCIVSGTDYLTQKHNWIDSTRLGLQGQSWGGYQTAQLITMTTKYKVAMAGAPVSNMFSAYGGIRWSSGLSRMFQYEKTQSRIGYTIWEKPELYIENSPIFKLDKVKTPLLIMHNDGDGAVPWYQGIELFMGLRRLDQPVWLLNYNGDGHNLMENANRIDLSIRMRQFFDYYLLDAPIPAWMSDGVPAIDKGKNYGLSPKID